MTAAAPAPRSLAPNETIYIHNLEERIKPEELKTSLATIFGTYGTILEIVAKQSLKRRGQAFIVYDNAESATKAIEQAQGFPLFEKPMIIEFARTKSDATIERRGDKRELELHKRHRLAEKERKQAMEAQLEQSKLKRPAGPVVEAAASRPIRKTGLKSTGGAAAVIPDEYLPPNKTLFIQNIPNGFDVDALSAVFGGFEGFREVRLVPGRKGIAFVEYEAEAGAISAKERMANVPLGDEQQIIKVTYQRQ